MDVYEALYTTRAMRRMHPDPIPMDVQARILDAAIRAPTGGNRQDWRFVLVDDPDLKALLAPLYREAIDDLWSGPYARRAEAARAAPEAPESAAFFRLQRSAQHLADHFEQTPLFLLAFTRNDPGGGSIWPAVWSAMLAARAEGVGSAVTTVLATRSDRVLPLLGVPEGKGWAMACSIPFGYPRGRWGVPQRRPVQQVAARNGWTGDLGFTVDRPLWPGAVG